MKISKKPLNLDPALSNMKDNLTAQTKQINWTVIVKELKNFGVKIDKERKEKLIEGRYVNICEVLSKLFDFDNGAPNTSKLLDASTQDMINETQGIDRSLNDIEGSPLKDDINKSMNINGQKDSTALIQNAPIPRKVTLDPLQISSLSKKNSVSKVAKTSIDLLNNQISSVSKIKNPMRLSNPELFNEIDINKDLSETDSTVEFILLGLSKSLGINPKQAVGLLSNNHKYLIHIAVKGTKGGDFSKISQWYSDLHANSNHLVQLIDKEKDNNSLTMTMNIIKSGLFSSNMDLVISCCRVMSKICQDINSIGGQLAGLAWDWFISNSMVQGEVSILDLNESMSNKNLQNQNTSQTILGESGLSACIYTLKRHTIELIEHIVPILIQFGKNNYFELFTHYLKDYFPDKAQYLNIAHDILVLVINISSGKQAIINSLVIDNWIDLAIKQADYDGINNPQERIAALSFLEELWELKPEKIQEKNDIAQTVLTMLKRGCRDKSKVLRITSCELMMKLLHIFAVDRNRNAPILYKTLTFLLIEFHMDLEIREQMLKHFKTIFEQIPSIPVSILCEPLLKQIQISDGFSYLFNVFDFEFFQVLCQHQRLNVNIAIQLVEILSRIAQSSIFFAKSAISIMIQLLQRYNKDPNLHHCFSQIFKQSLQIIAENENQRIQSEQDKKKFTIQHKRDEEQLIKNTLNKYILKKMQEQEKQKKIEEDQILEAATLARKTKEKLIVNMIQKMLMIGNGIIKQDLRMQLLSMYTKIEKQYKVKSKCISYLLKLFGENVPQMLQYYIEHELPKQEQYQEELFPFNENNSQQLVLKSEEISLPDTDPQMQLELYENKKVSKTTQIQEKALREIERIKANKLEQTQKKALEEELKKMKDEKQKTLAKQKVEERKILHGVEPKMMTRGQSEDKVQNVLIVKAKEVNQSIDYYADSNQRQLVPYKSERDYSIVSGNSPIKKLAKKMTEIKLLDIRLEEQKDQDAVRFLVQKHIKILKLLFSQYCFSGSNQNVTKTFEEQTNKLSQMTLAEVIKMLKDYNITNLQVPKNDLMQIVKLINKEILKKVQKNQSSLLILDFEGFVELMLQLAVYIYSFDGDMAPAEYLQKLIDHFRKVAKEKKLSTVKLFEEPDLATIGDTSLIMELNKRLFANPNFTLPEGFSKFVQKEVVNNYRIPDQFPIAESQKIVIEVLDQFLSEKFNIHFLEPMTEVKEVYKARQNVKQIYSQQQLVDSSNIKRYMQAIKPKTRSRARDKISTSLDVGTIRASKKQINNKEKNLSPYMTIPQMQQQEINPTLNPCLKLEVARVPIKQRPYVLETAYVLEEILQAVEQNQDRLQPRKSAIKQKIMNKALEEKRNKIEEDEKLKQQQKQRLEQRKQILKEQLEKMKGEQTIKTKELQQQKKQQEQQEKEQERRKQEAKKLAFQHITKGMEEKRAKKEEEERKKKEEEEKKRSMSLDKQKQVKEQMKKKREQMQETFKKQTLERQSQKEKEQEEKKKQEELQKKKKEQANQTYANQKMQVQEKREKLRQEYNQFKDSEEVRNLLQKYDRSLRQLFDQYCKIDKNIIGQMSFNAFKQLGQRTQIVPQVLTSQELVYIYKATLRDKVKNEVQNLKEDNIESTKLSYMEFIELMFKISCFSRDRLGGTKKNEDQTNQDMQKSNETSSQKNLFQGGDYSIEREYDVQNMTANTIQNLFKFLHLKPLKDYVNNNSMTMNNNDTLDNNEMNQDNDNIDNNEYQEVEQQEEL